MQKIERDEPPYADNENLPSDNIHWVEPRLVAEIRFEEWTDAGKLRHPRYQGLREDKNPTNVVREDT